MTSNDFHLQNSSITDHLQSPMPKDSVIKSLILAFRPKTLTASLVPCLAASALAFHHFENIHVWILFYALAASFFIQIGTNLVNDAVDFKKGADTETRLGPQRITQSGILKPKTVLFIATLFFMAAVGFGIPLVMVGGWPIIFIGLLSVLMGYAYTAGPYPLAYKGLGDLFVILFFGLLAVGGLYFLFTQQLNISALILGLQVGLHATVLIAINNLRDIQGDSLVGKKTLAVRLGKGGAKKEISFLLFLPYCLQLFWFVQSAWWAIILPFLSLPLAFKIYKNIQSHEPSPIYNKFLAQSAGLHLIFGLMLSLGLILS